MPNLTDTLTTRACSGDHGGTEVGIHPSAQVSLVTHSGARGPPGLTSAVSIPDLHPERGNRPTGAMFCGYLEQFHHVEADRRLASGAGG